MDDVGVKINGRFYPLPTGFTLGEARTIQSLTGMSIPDFGASLEKLGEDQNFDVVTAFVWLHMHREDKKITPEDAENVEVTDIEFVGGEKPKAEAADDSPPVTGGRLSHESPADKPEPSEPSAQQSNEEPGVSWAKTPVSTGTGG